MKLQTRLLITTLLASVPLVVSLLWYERRSRFAMIESSLESTVLEVMRGETLERCERDPSSFAPKMSPNPLMNRHGRSGRPMGGSGLGNGMDGAGPMPMRLFPYGRDLRPGHPQSPVLDPDLVEAIRDGRPLASRPIDFDGHVGFEALVAVPGGNACAFVLVRRPVPAIVFSSPFQIRTSVAWLFPSLGLLGAVYLGLGQLVQRLVRLTRDVRASTQAAYADLPADAGTDEIAELRRAFVEAGREIRKQLASLETNERILREFLANTTHDVMLPLTVLQGHLAALVEGRQSLGQQATEALTGALRESHYIGALLRNLALAARLDAEQPLGHRETFDLGEMVARAVARHRFMANQQHIELNFAIPDEPVEVVGESVSIEQAVSNVIYNAVAYNRVGGHVAVLLESDRDHQFSLRVTDDGPGVPAQELARLVERHFRGDAARSRSQGGGLGLHIADRVCRIHGWVMSLDNAPQGGLEVTFRGSLPEAAPLRGAGLD